MNMKEIIGLNIQQIIAEKKINISELIDHLKISRQTLSNYIKGTSVIDSIKLYQLAEFLSVPMEDFFKETKDTPSYQLLFRTSLSQEESSLAVQDYVIDYVETHKRLLELLDEYTITFPQNYSLYVKNNGTNCDINKCLKEYVKSSSYLSVELRNQIENIANDQRKILNAENLVGFDLINAIAESGIHIFFVDFKNDSISGVSAITENSGCYIFVNCYPTITLERQIFTIAHEYGHIIMHRPFYKKDHTNNSYLNPKEMAVLDRMANEFAGDFLCPKYLLNSYKPVLQDIIRFNDLYPIKHHFQISLSALIIALKKAGYVSPSQVKRYFDLLEFNGMEKQEMLPLKDIPLVIEQYNKIKNSVINNKIQMLVMNSRIDDDQIFDIVKNSEFEQVYLDCLRQKNN